MHTCTLGILSDIHYASAAEQACGPEFEMRAIPNPRAGLFARFYRHYLWQRDPLGKNHLLDQGFSILRGAVQQAWRYGGGMGAERCWQPIGGRGTSACTHNTSSFIIEPSAFPPAFGQYKHSQ